MAGFPLQPEAFAEQVLAILVRNHPERQAALIAPLAIVVDGRPLNLDNLHRMVARDPQRGVEIVEHYLDRVIEGDALSTTPVPLPVAMPRIMPRIQPESIFEHLDREQVAHVPFVNGTVIVFVLDMPQMTVSITTEQMIRWRLDTDDLERIARENLSRYSPNLEVQVVESPEGGKAAIVAEQDGYDAARLLLDGIHRQLAPQLGGDFYVATPARDRFLAISAEPRRFLDRLQERAQEEFRRLPYPITTNLFLVTRDGVAGTAA
jgi:uncharacterized protein YtpQ (UPF0354 family)